MKTAAAYAAVAMVAIYVFISFIVGPVALKQDARMSTADIKHPPTLYGSAAVAAPESPKRHEPLNRQTPAQ